MTTSAHTVITGHAYGQRCTLEIAGDTLTWRAQRGMPPTAENIVTTVHDVRHARWVVRAWSYVGLALALLGMLWVASGEGVLLGGAALLGGLGLVAYRRSQPRQQLVLELAADRSLVMNIGPDCSDAARDLVARVDRALTSGEVPVPPPLP